jgi:hypothetical protein
MSKAVIDLSREDMTRFFTLHNAYNAADKPEDIAKTSWAFLCFVSKHLGEDMLSYFVDKMYVGDDAKRTIKSLVKMRKILQPHLFETY